jgi:translation initiation factor IF-3
MGRWWISILGAHTKVRLFGGKWISGPKKVKIMLSFAGRNQQNKGFPGHQALHQAAHQGRNLPFAALKSTLFVALT